MLRYHPDDPRSSTEGYDGSLTQEEQIALDDLTSAVEDLDLRMVSGDYGQDCLDGDHAVEPLRLLLLRFLRGNGFSVTRALSQLKECVDYRVQHPVDRLLSQSPREVLGCDPELYYSLYPRWLMGFDRLGRPIMVQQYGSLRTWEATKITTIERMATLHAREQELILRALRRRTLEKRRSRGEDETRNDEQTSHIVDTVVVVVDTAGLTLRHVTKDFVRLFKLRSITDQLLFPEMMGKCIIVNTPSLFGYVWAMFSPMVDARTRSKIAVISRLDDYKAALLEIADADQISPEYGGTGPSRADRLSIAEALHMAGSSSDLSDDDSETPSEGAYISIVPRVGGSGLSGQMNPRIRDIARASTGDGSSGALVVNLNNEEMYKRGGMHILTPVKEEDEEDEEEIEPQEEKEDDRGGWFSNTLQAFGRWWGEGYDVSMEKKERELTPEAHDSLGTIDEDEFFDALSELDDPAMQRWDDSSHQVESKKSGDEDAKTVKYRHHDAGASWLTQSLPGDHSSVLWRRRSRVAPGDETKADSLGLSPERPGSLSGSSITASEQSGNGDKIANHSEPACLSGVLWWCLKPVLRILLRRGVEQLVRWLGIVNAISVLLAVASIVVGTFSISTSWLGAVLGWQWAAISAVCLGSLLLPLSLMGTVGARVQNRFTLLGFAALEASVGVATLLMGGWCLAHARGSATVSDLTWDTIAEERNPSVTKEEFIGGARERLIALGASGLITSVYSMFGPCLLALALAVKIRQVEGNTGAWSDGRKRFVQLRRWFQETNVFLTVFAVACTGYGGWALSFIISLGLVASVTSTYLMLAGGYILLLACAVGAWAAASNRPEAYRLHFGALVSAGVLYASLTVVQLVRAQSSNEYVENDWSHLHTDIEDLSKVQAQVKTMLIVGGVLSAATFLLEVAAIVASWATRKALLELENNAANTRTSRMRVRLSRGEKFAIAWALALALISTFLDGSLAVFSAWLARDCEEAVWLVEFWRAMGKGDRRYVEGDAFVVATAIVVAAVVGPGSLLYAWSVYCRKGFRFSVGILVCTASLYTQVLRYVTRPVEPSSGDSDGSSGQTAVLFVTASVILALLQVVGALVVLLYNIRRMTMRVHAAEVQYRALISEHDKLESGDVTRSGVPGRANKVSRESVASRGGAADMR